VSSASGAAVRCSGCCYSVVVLTALLQFLKYMEEERAVAA
jgi:hypothetical protein